MTLRDGNICISSGRCAQDESDDKLTYYPAYCYKASPTYFKWVKLSAFDIHYVLSARTRFQTAPALTETNSGRAQSDGLLLFYLNHPIQFIQVVGVVVAFEDYFEKFWVFSIDDSSGSTIEVVCWKPIAQAKRDGSEADHTPVNKVQATDETARIAAMSGIGVGTVVQVKGRLALFRSVRQIQLERVTILCDTNQEMQWISSRTSYVQETLSKSWNLSVARQKQLLKEAHGEAKEESTRVKRRRGRQNNELQREARHALKIAKKYQHEEVQRQKAAEEARRAGQTLQREQTMEECEYTRYT